MVDVQTETVEKYIKEGKIKPDLEVPVGDRRSFKYFREETVKKYASEFGWELITAANMKDKFMDMVRAMDMSFSYKPVLLKAMFEHADENGRVRVEDIVDYFIGFYSDRRNKGLVVEKKTSIFCKEGFTRKEVERNIFINPFKRFEDMRFMRRCQEIEYVEFNRHIFRKLTREDTEWIKEHCDRKLESGDTLVLDYVLGTINPHSGLSPVRLRPCWAHCKKLISNSLLMSFFSSINLIKLSRIIMLKQNHIFATKFTQCFIFTVNKNKIQLFSQYLEY